MSKDIEGSHKSINQHDIVNIYTAIYPTTGEHMFFKYK